MPYTEEVMRIRENFPNGLDKRPLAIGGEGARLNTCLGVKYNGSKLGQSPLI